MTPEQRMRLYLLQNGFPANNIPILLKYCPNLLTKFPLEDLAILSIANINQFKPAKKSIVIRPFVYSALLHETKGRDIFAFIEEAIAIFCQDSFEQVTSDMLEQVKNNLGEHCDYPRIPELYKGE